MTKLKQAKDEAERDSAAYRSALEEEYQRKISKVLNILCFLDLTVLEDA